MEARAHARYIRMSPRKVKAVADLIRQKPVGEAMTILTLSKRIAREPLIKLLKSAMANAENNHNMDLSRCYVAEAHCGAGVTLKRIRPAAKGSAHRILKRTSNIVLVVKEKD